MRKNSLPALGVCPRCSSELSVIARTGNQIGSLSASDELQWRCVSCNYQDKETRYLVDGVDGHWPESKFARPRSVPDVEAGGDGYSVRNRT